MINMRGYEELLDQFHGCSSSFALLRYDEGPALIGTETDQISLENASCILAYRLHCKTTFSKNDRTQKFGCDLTDTQASLPIRPGYWHSRRLEQRPSGRIGLRKYAEVLVIPLHRIWRDHCWYGKDILAS
jgi:hypothetical protein